MTRHRPRRVRARLTTGIAAVAVLAGLFGGVSAASAADPGTASIAGIVTGPDGAPLSGVTVYASEKDEYYTHVGSSTTDESGQYAITGILGGQYRVEFRPGPVGGPYAHAPEYWDDAIERASSTVITVAAGASITGIDAELSLGASISGVVTDADGEPIYRAYVTASRNDGPERTVYTDRDGSYTIDGQTAGIYRVVFREPSTSSAGYAEEWWDGAEGAAAYRSATPIVLAAGDARTGIDATLETGATIAGRVVDLDGEPMGAYIALSRPSDAGSRSEFSRVYTGRTTSDFSFTGLPRGEYEIEFRWSSPASNTEIEYWQDVPHGDTSTLIAVSGADEVALGDVRMGGYLTRAEGKDRYGTSAAVSQSTFPDPDAVSTVYVASGKTFPDALAAAPIAGLEGAPVLLTRRDSLPEVVADEIARLAPERIVIAGGEASVGAAVAARLAQLTSGTVERVAGPNRYATAVEISRSRFTPGVAAVYLVSGATFPDALAAAPLVTHEEGPLLLTSGDRLPPVVAAELARLRPAKIVVIGGEPSVSAAVAQEAAAVAGSALERIAGANRYATAAAIAARFDERPPMVYVTNGKNFPDALAGAPAAVMNGVPILLTNGGGPTVAGRTPVDTVNPVTAAQLERLRPTHTIVLGSQGAVFIPVFRALERIVIAF